MQGKPENKIFRTVTVNEKGQIVIPVDVRKEMGIEPGTKLVIFTHQRFSTKALMLIHAAEFEEKLQGIWGWFFKGEFESADE